MPFPAATRLTKRLGDPHSLAFYRRIAATVPEHRVFKALSETRIASRESRIRRIRGAYFTSLIARDAVYSSEHGTTRDRGPTRG